MSEDPRIDLLALALAEIHYPDYDKDPTLAAEILEKLDAAQPDVCPFDCDSCHSEECPCDRLGCAGSKEEGEG